jgi:hypothetical protein
MPHPPSRFHPVGVMGEGAGPKVTTVHRRLETSTTTPRCGAEAVGEPSMNVLHNPARARTHTRVGKVTRPGGSEFTLRRRSGWIRLTLR